jgi:flagellar basal body-associated protein FliL
VKKKLMILVPVLLVVLGGAYKFVLAKPAAEAKPPNVEGTVYMLAKEFLVNLEGDRFAKLTVGLLLEHGDTSTVAEGGHEAAKPPEGFGTMPQEGVVRDVITDELTGLPADDLVEGEAREKVKKAIAKSLKKHTDVHVEEVLFTDVTVQ